MVIFRVAGSKSYLMDVNDLSAYGVARLDALPKKQRKCCFWYILKCLE